MRASASIETAAHLLLRALFGLPDPVLGLLAGPLPEHAAGLSPDAWLLARIAALAERPMDSMSVPEVRARFELVTAPFSLRPDLPLAIEDLALPVADGAQRERADTNGSSGEVTTISARLYSPLGAPRPGPLVVYYHGGGWVEGSIASHDRSCRLLAHLSGVKLLSVGYRLAPEHPFPTAAEDALAAYAYVVEHHADLGADLAKLAVGGDSAGGNLAAVTAQSAHAESSLPDPAFQLLIYPALDMSTKHQSRRLFAKQFLLTDEVMSWFERQYVPEESQRADTRVSPLLSPDLEGLPPAYIATCIVDPLRDEGELYAQRLREAGVPLVQQRHPLLHGFLNTSITRGGRQALATIAGALAQGLA